MGLIQALCTEVDLIIDERLVDVVSAHYLYWTTQTYMESVAPFLTYATQNQL